MNETSIIAGHFPWDIWNKLPNFSNSIDLINEGIISSASSSSSSSSSNPIKNVLNHNFKKSLIQEKKSNPPPVDCFVMGRHPVDRGK
jgi:hypothetical protein